MSELTAKRLRELVHYDPETGTFRRRSFQGNQKAGSIAGSDDGRGYTKIWIDGRRYRASRLAFLYMRGRWPKDQIDHINHVRDDDRWSNLREASRSDNNQNLSLRSDNTTGHTGVYWYKPRQKWCAQIKVDGKRHHLGYYDDIEEAIMARQEATREYHFHSNHGKAADAFLRGD